MNSIKNSEKQTGNSCIGRIGDVEFNAGRVELTTEIFPPEHGEAHVMLARHRNPDHSLRHITLSFKKLLAAGSYELKPDSDEVRLNLAELSTASTVLYSQISGTAKVAFDDGIFSGTLEDAVVEHEEEDGGKKTLTINIEFSAMSDVALAGKFYNRTQAA
ncbi:hypothetical protein ACYZT3_15645 [Pseudomonas sp. MDT1-16]